MQAHMTSMHLYMNMFIEVDKIYWLNLHLFIHNINETERQVNEQIKYNVMKPNHSLNVSLDTVGHQRAANHSPFFECFT